MHVRTDFCIVLIFRVQVPSVDSRKVGTTDYSRAQAEKDAALLTSASGGSAASAAWQEGEDYDE